MTHVFKACLMAGALAACTQVLGIEQAHVDPTIQADSGATPDLVGDPLSGSPTAPSDDGSATDDAGGLAPDEAGTNEEASAGADAGVSTLCDQYCSAIVSGCTDSHAQYIDRAACLASCAYFAVGSPGDTTGNSINCRFTYAKKASSEPYTYCTWAGPGGDGKCGSNCDGFCTLMMRACTPQSTGKPGGFFASASACESTCAGLRDIGNYSASDRSQQVGADHVQCRLYHAGAAVANGDPATHCPHAMGETLCASAAKN